MENELNSGYLDQLNDQQREAVEYLDGPALVIAGAGSGKTRVLTYKIVHLIENGFDPASIVALTFTNKAAREMKERISALVGESLSRKLWMGTFHSIFLRILRAHAEKLGYDKNFTIYDANDSRSLVKLIVKDLGLDDKTYKPSHIASMISNAKNALILPEAYAADKELTERDRIAGRPQISQIYSAYCKRCKLAGAMDFDDILVNMNILLRDFPDVREYYRNYFSYILVDEYQDSNFVQNLIVTTLSGDNGALCVVGDDAQSIYSFRGANISNILNMGKQFSNLRIFKLERNYRSTQNIINAAGALIAHNRNQIPKHVFSEKEKGSPVSITEAYSDIEEAYLAASSINTMSMTSHDSYADFAILYRTNSQSRLLEEALRNRNMPYRIYGGITFYQRKEVKDAICYMRLAVNPHDDEALRRVINFPARGIGDTTLKKIHEKALSEGVSLWDVVKNPEKYPLQINSGTRKKLDAFAMIIDSAIESIAKGENAAETVAGLYNLSGLAQLYIHESTPEEVSKRENIMELLRDVNEFVDTQTESGNETMGLSDFLSQVSLATDQDTDDADDRNKVTLMTVHAAKGLEFKHVLIVGMEDELFPSALSAGNPDEIEEERRLFYVALTRAMKTCHILYSRSRFHNGMSQQGNPSRFLFELDPSCINVSASSQMNMSRRRNFQTDTHRQGPYVTNVIRKTSPASVNAPRNINSGNYRILSREEVSEGMSVRHQKFGNGKITGFSERGSECVLNVRFEDSSDRKLILRFAKLEIIDK